MKAPTDAPSRRGSLRQSAKAGFRVHCYSPPNFYRHLEAALDLSFVRELVRDRYAGIGRPSLDPIVFFKTQPTHYPH